MSWRDQAACADVNVEVMFPTTREGVDRAKAHCTGCPVREECLAYSFEAPERHGVWGGKSAEERNEYLQTGEWPDDHHDR